MLTKHVIFAAVALMPIASGAQTFVKTPAYEWHGDTVKQGPYKAVAVSATHIVSDYSAQPGYFMPIDKEWTVKNDISPYPQLSTPNTMHRAVYNLALDEMVNAVEPDTTLRTGREWPGVWTRDVSYSILLSMAYMQPMATKISLMRKVDSLGRIVQDTGSGGAWPVSTDRMIWVCAAYELYKVTGDRQWLEYIYPIIKKSLYDDRQSGFYDGGLVQGETSFIDWREQSYPKWMQTADIYRSQALGTSVVHARAWQILAKTARLLGQDRVAQDALEQADAIAKAINQKLWMPDKGLYAMYLYGRDNLIMNPRAETLGLSLAIMWDIADKDRAKKITASNPTTPFGTAVFYPQIADMPAYHNNAQWPWVAAWWALANAKAKNPGGVLEAIGSIVRPAALFATNKENFRLDNGDIATELNSSNMLWCLAGNIAMTHRILFGIAFTDDGLAFSPFVPEALGARRTLYGFAYRGATLNITVDGFGDSIASFSVNGKKQPPLITPSQAKDNAVLDVEIKMCNRPIAPVGINRTENRKAPLTPVARLKDNTLHWDPIEYIGDYIVIKDGKEIARTRATTFDATVPGEYMVIGVAGDGTPGFASQPVSNRQSLTIVLENDTAMRSAETAYPAEGPLYGYTGNGFAETDCTTADITLTADVPQDGLYALTLRYANGNGPVNTENRCAVRTVAVDGKDLGTIVMPQRGRGNWTDWGQSNAVDANLSAGRHVITIKYLPHNTNMNIGTNHALIDAVTLTKKDN